jgi:hypothetical protein
LKRIIFICSLFISLDSLAGGPLCENGDPMSECPWEGKTPIREFLYKDYNGAEDDFLKKCKKQFKEHYSYAKILIEKTTETTEYNGSFILVCKGKIP